MCFSRTLMPCYLCRNAATDSITTACEQYHWYCRVCYNEWIRQEGLTQFTSCPVCYFDSIDFEWGGILPQRYHPEPTIIMMEDLEMNMGSGFKWNHGPLLHITNEIGNLKSLMGPYIRYKLQCNFSGDIFFQMLMSQSENDYSIDDGTLDEVLDFVMCKSEVVPEICKTRCMHVEIVSARVRGFRPGDMEYHANPDGEYENEDTYYCPKYTLIVPNVKGAKKWITSPVKCLKYEVGYTDLTIGPYVRYTKFTDGVVTNQILVDAAKGLLDYWQLEQFIAYCNYEYEENCLEDRYVHVERMATNLRSETPCDIEEAMSQDMIINWDEQMEDDDSDSEFNWELDSISGYLGASDYVPEVIYFPVFPTTILKDEPGLMSSEDDGVWIHNSPLPIAYDIGNLKSSDGLYVRYEYVSFYSEETVFQMLMKYNARMDDKTLDDIKLYVIGKSEILPEILKANDQIFVELVTAKNIRGFDCEDSEIVNNYQELNPDESPEYHCPKITSIIPAVVGDTKWVISDAKQLKYNVGPISCEAGPYIRYSLVLDNDEKSIGNEQIVFQALIDTREGIFSDSEMYKIREFFRCETEENLAKDRYIYVEVIDAPLLKLNF